MKIATTLKKMVLTEVIVVRILLQMVGMTIVRFANAWSHHHLRTNSHQQNARSKRRIVIIKVIVRQNCLKTCGECQDLWPEKKCKKMTAKKCKKAKFAKKCLESCGICEAAGL